MSAPPALHAFLRPLPAIVGFGEKWRCVVAVFIMLFLAYVSASSVKSVLGAPRPSGAISLYGRVYVSSAFNGRLQHHRRRENNAAGFLYWHVIIQGRAGVAMGDGGAGDMLLKQLIASYGGVMATLSAKPRWRICHHGRVFANSNLAASAYDTKRIENGNASAAYAALRPAAKRQHRRPVTKALFVGIKQT